MKKILNILGALSLVSVCGSSIVACDTDTEGDTNEKGDGETPTKKTVKLSELFTKLEIDLKGENDPLSFAFDKSNVEAGVSSYLNNLLRRIVEENMKINKEIFTNNKIYSIYLPDIFIDYNSGLYKIDTPEIKDLIKKLTFDENAELEPGEGKYRIQLFKEVSVTYIIQPELFMSLLDSERDVKMGQKFMDVVELEPLVFTLKNFRVTWYINS